MTKSPELIVDFNDLDAERRVVAFLADENAGWSLEVGEEVLLRDEDGNSVRAVVSSLSEGEALVEPAWSTWQARDAVRISPQPSSPQRDLYYELASRLPQVVSRPSDSDLAKN
jgi:hypothetical protein